jgi:hypothetical protein
MADGRCLTFLESNRVMTTKMMASAGLNATDNAGFRQLLQEKGPDVIGFQNDMSCLRPWALASDKDK